MGVIALVPLVGAIGVIGCQVQRLTLPALYFKLNKKDSLWVYYLMIALLVIHIFTILAFPLVSSDSGCQPLLIAFSVALACGVMGCGLGPLGRTTEDFCCDGTAASTLRDLFTDDINTEAYYDVLKLMYLTSTCGKYALADAAGEWVAKQCMADTTTFIIFYSMALCNIITMPLQVCFPLSWRNLIGNSEYQRIDGEVIHETIDISK